MMMMMMMMIGAKLTITVHLLVRFHNLETYRPLSWLAIVLSPSNGLIADRLQYTARHSTCWSDGVIVDQDGLDASLSLMYNMLIKLKLHLFRCVGVWDHGIT